MTTFKNKGLVGAWKKGWAARFAGISANDVPYWDTWKTTFRTACHNAWVSGWYAADIRLAKLERIKARMRDKPPCQLAAEKRLAQTVEQKEIPI